ncbi:hypothetical protein K474DRAFT_1678199 [Panus rudis PR-1116 ss-1]|nr:hypothetical protein K474DRAFT_1678199 [Panus rudis PR-1116 ss-1]
MSTIIYFVQNHSEYQTAFARDLRQSRKQARTDPPAAASTLSPVSAIVGIADYSISDPIQEACAHAPQESVGLDTRGRERTTGWIVDGWALKTVLGVLHIRLNENLHFKSKHASIVTTVQPLNLRICLLDKPPSGRLVTQDSAHVRKFLISSTFAASRDPSTNTEWLLFIECRWIDLEGLSGLKGLDSRRCNPCHLDSCSITNSRPPPRRCNQRERIACEDCVWTMLTVKLRKMLKATETEMRDRKTVLRDETHNNLMNVRTSFATRLETGPTTAPTVTPSWIVQLFLNLLIKAVSGYAVHVNNFTCKWLGDSLHDWEYQRNSVLDILNMTMIFVVPLLMEKPVDSCTTELERDPNPTTAITVWRTLVERPPLSLSAREARLSTPYRCPNAEGGLSRGFLSLNTVFSMFTNALKFLLHIHIRGVSDTPRQSRVSYEVETNRLNFRCSSAKAQGGSLYKSAPDGDRGGGVRIPFWARDQTCAVVTLGIKRLPLQRPLSPSN